MFLYRINFQILAVTYYTRISTTINAFSHPCKCNNLSKKTPFPTIGREKECVTSKVPFVLSSNSNYLSFPLTQPPLKLKNSSNFQSYMVFIQCPLFSSKFIFCLIDQASLYLLCPWVLQTGNMILKLFYLNQNPLQQGMTCNFYHMKLYLFKEVLQRNL